MKTVEEIELIDYSFSYDNQVSLRIRPVTKRLNKSTYYLVEIIGNTCDNWGVEILKLKFNSIKKAVNKYFELCIKLSAINEINK